MNDIAVAISHDLEFDMARTVDEVLEIWSGDAKTKDDIPRWATKVGHEYLGFVEAEGYDRIFIKRLK